MYIQQNHPPFLAGVGGGVVARVVSAVVAEVACVVLAVVACVVLACVVVLVAVDCFAVAVVVLVDFYKKYLDFTCVHFQNLCICTLPCFPVVWVLSFSWCIHAVGGRLERRVCIPAVGRRLEGGVYIPAVGGRGVGVISCSCGGGGGQQEKGGCT